MMLVCEFFVKEFLETLEYLLDPRTDAERALDQWQAEGDTGMQLRSFLGV